MLINQEGSTVISVLWCACRSVAVRMEDYEVYYRKQKADSNCGFAEEFEVEPQFQHQLAIFNQHLTFAVFYFFILLFVFFSIFKGPEACWYRSVKNRCLSPGEQAQEPLQQRAPLWVTRASCSSSAAAPPHSSLTMLCHIVFITSAFFVVSDDSSRVKLSIIYGSPYDDYINANYMPVRTDAPQSLLRHSFIISTYYNRPLFCCFPSGSFRKD